MSVVSVEKHELAPGGEVAYFMTGPEGAFAVFPQSVGQMDALLTS